MSHRFNSGDKVTVILRRHTYRKNRNEEPKELPAQEIEGVFVRYHNEDTSAYVKINTVAEGERLQSFRIERLKPREGA